MRSEKLQIFSGKTFVLLHLRCLELVRYIKNGYNKQINSEKKINFEKNLKFGKSLASYCSIKLYWCFFGFLLAETYLGFTYELLRPSGSYHTSHVNPIYLN